MYSKWSTLRDDLQDALGQSAKNVEAAADALMSITKAYADQDTDNARQIMHHVFQHGLPDKYQLSYEDTEPFPSPGRVTLSGRE
jgi:hypothetical protein